MSLSVLLSMIFFAEKMDNFHFVLVKFVGKNLLNLLNLMLVVGNFVFVKTNYFCVFARECLVVCGLFT